MDLSDLTPAAIVVAVIGGFAASILLRIIHPTFDRLPRDHAIRSAWIIATVATVFEIGVIVDCAVERPDLVGHSVVIYFLWLVFSLTVGVGTYVVDRQLSKPVKQ